MNVLSVHREILTSWHWAVTESCHEPKKHRSFVCSCWFAFISARLHIPNSTQQEIFRHELKITLHAVNKIWDKLSPRLPQKHALPCRDWYYYDFINTNNPIDAPYLLFFLHFSCKSIDKHKRCYCYCIILRYLIIYPLGQFHTRFQ